MSPSTSATDFSAESLEGLFTAQTVTIVGASKSSSSVGFALANMLDGPSRRFEGTINLVSRSRPVLHGLQAVGSTEEVEGPPGLVMLFVPPSECVSVLESFSELPRGVVVYSSGAELGYDAEQTQLAAWSLRTGVPLLGPQSTGVVRPTAALTALTARLRAPAPEGRIGLVMQSAGLLGGALNALLERGIGIHTAVSIGNAAVLGLDRLGRHLLEETSIGALGVYVDTLPSINGLIELAQAADAREVPIVLAVGGSSEAGTAAVLSHTGALATPRRILEGVAEQFGIVLVPDTDELVWALDAISQIGFERPPSGGVGVFSTSGGGAIMLADALTSSGVELPLPTPAVREALSQSREIISFNPFDVGAAAFDRPGAMLDAMNAFAGDPSYGLILSVATIGLPTQTEMEPYVEQTRTFVDVVRAAGKLPVIVAPVASVRGTADPALQEWPGIPVAAGIKEGASKVRALAIWGNSRALLEGYQPDGWSNGGGEDVQPRVTSGLPAQAELEGLAVSWPHEISVASIEELEDVVGGLPYPVVAKAEAGLAHRLASGGLVRGVDTPEAADLAATYLLRRFDGSVSFVEEVGHDAEYVIGFQRDPRNGPLLMFGIGGSDVGADVSFRRLPISSGQLRALVRRYASEDEAVSLHYAIASFVDLVSGRPDIVSLDLNPVATVNGVVIVLDAKIHTRPAAAI